MNKNMIDKINRVPIFDIMNVKGYCVYIEGVLRTFVFAQDIAREAGLIKLETDYRRPLADPQVGGQKYLEYDRVRWDRFNHYVNMSIESFKRINPSILPLIQLPINSNSYIPCELALVVLMHCKSKKALDFQVKLATLIMPKIQQDTIDFYEKEIDNLRYVIDTNRDIINHNIAFLQDIAEYGSPRELKDIIMNMTY